MKSFLAAWPKKSILAVTLKAFANFSPGPRPGISINDSIRRTLKVFARSLRTLSGFAAHCSGSRLPRALPWAGISERFQRLFLSRVTDGMTSPARPQLLLTFSFGV